MYLGFLFKNNNCFVKSKGDFGFLFLIKIIILLYHLSMCLFFFLISFFPFPFPFLSSVLQMSFLLICIFLSSCLTFFTSSISSLFASSLYTILLQLAKPSSHTQALYDLHESSMTYTNPLQFTQMLLVCFFLTHLKIIKFSMTYYQFYISFKIYCHNLHLLVTNHLFFPT